jgi:predicted homoserine dehydrogenase-like protein
MKVVCIADLDAEKARKACIRAGWPEAAVGDAHSPSSINEGAACLEVIVEATGVTDDFA